MKDIYVYPNTYVLVNKLNIRDAKKLELLVLCIIW